MPVRFDGSLPSILKVASAATRAAAAAAPAPLRPLLEVGASGFQAAQRLLVNLEGALPSPTGGEAGDPLDEPWRVRVSSHSTGDVNLRAEPGTAAALLGTLPAGTELDVLGTEQRGGRQWMRVRTPDGTEGWIVSERTEHLSGLARGHPYVLADGRDGSRPTALDHALTFVSSRARTELQTALEAMPEGPEREALWALLERIPEGNVENFGHGYADRCLGFVNDNFGVAQAGDRCRPMSNPDAFLLEDQRVPAPLGPEGEPIHPRERAVLPEGQVYADLSGSAYGAWLALVHEGQVTAGALDVEGNPVLTEPLAEGAILFFAPSQDNWNAGHVCIATGALAADGTPLVITSGWAGSKDVKVMSLAQMESATGGRYLGYTTPEQAFDPARWGGGEAP